MFKQEAAVKQEPISPHYLDIPHTSTTPTPQRYTPSPNYQLSQSPNIPNLGRYDMSYVNIPSNVNQQYQNPPNQFNIPTTDTATNFIPIQTNQDEQRNLADILTNNILGHANQLDNLTNANNENVLENSGISGLLVDMDSQQLIASDILRDIMANLPLDPNQNVPPINIDDDEDNISDRIKQCSLK